MMNSNIKISTVRDVIQQKSIKKTIILWHRNIGIVIAFFVLVLALSGVSLNHTDSLNLDKKFVEESFVLNLYGIETPDEIRAYSIAGQWISQVGQRIFFNDTELTNVDGLLVGAVEYDDLIVAAFTQQILLLTRQGELVDQLTEAAGLTGNLTSISSHNNEVWILSSGQVYSSDSDLLEWQVRDVSSVPWASPSELSKEMKHKLETLYRGKGLSYERILLDVHSGRILGSWGVLIMDFSAILLIVMSLSGILLWLKGNNKQKTNAK